MCIGMTDLCAQWPVRRARGRARRRRARRRRIAPVPPSAFAASLLRSLSCRPLYLTMLLDSPRLYNRIVIEYEKICKWAWPDTHAGRSQTQHALGTRDTNLFSTRRKLYYTHANGVHGRTLAEVKCEFRQRYGVGGPEEGRLRLDVLSSYSAPAPNNMCR